MAGANGASITTGSTEVSSGFSPQTRYAIKTALSLTLAYLLPMAMGWPQPQTAATTVMLIAATGMVSESLQKGVLRVLGTVAGAIIGLSLIALFPQDRLLYLFVVSLVVAFVIYLYGVYQGDSTVFMLTAVVTLMVFNGGDAEGAFIYGIDRAFMTAFGVVVYTVVASMLWPVRVADNTRMLARSAGQSMHDAFLILTNDSRRDSEQPLATLLTAQEEFQNHFTAVRQDAEGVKRYLDEWSAVSACLARVEAALVPALRDQADTTVEYRRFISNYDQIITNIEAMFRTVELGWSGEASVAQLTTIAAEFDNERIARLPHRDIAQIATRADCLQQVQRNLEEMIAALSSIVFEQPGFKATTLAEGRPNFRWLDRESLFTGVRAFVTFWIACAIWINFNPPGGFMFVTLCTILIPLVSYTPVTPKLLFILFTFGFVFALAAYVFVLPKMTHWLELGLFLFCYAFIGFYVFKGPVSIFFLLGLFTLGIQNTMSYNFAVIMSIILMFYIVCAMLIISVNFPFTSNRAKLYAGLRRRFFRNCANIITGLRSPGFVGRWLVKVRLDVGDALITKMRGWGPMIDNGYYNRCTTEAITSFTAACDVLQGELRAVRTRLMSASDNPLVGRAIRQSDGSIQSALCLALVDGNQDNISALFEHAASEAQAAKKRLDHLLQDADIAQYSNKELADFYVFLNLTISLYRSLVACKDAAGELDWQQLQGHQF
jgi:uncharacterized membrane protein YccC